MTSFSCPIKRESSQLLCLRGNLICDGASHCRNGEDEQNCRKNSRLFVTLVWFTFQIKCATLGNTAARNSTSAFLLINVVMALSSAPMVRMNSTVAAASALFTLSRCIPVRKAIGASERTTSAFRTLNVQTRLSKIRCSALRLANVASTFNLFTLHFLLPGLFESLTCMS